MPLRQAIEGPAGAVFHAVMNTVLDGLIIIDQAGDVQHFNHAAERIFGYPAAEVVGRNVNMLMPAPYHGGHDAYLRNYLHSGEKKVIGIGRQVSGRRRDGSEFPMELGVNEMQLDGNRMFVGTIRDISERAAAEHEIRSHVNALQRSNQELDDFAYIASHDLKEPLRGLSHNARFLMEDFGDQISEAGQRRLARMTYLCQRMERLVDDLLYFSRLGRQDLAVKPTDLNAIIDDIETMMETTLQEAGARIIIPERLPVIICDQPRVAELFRNLITNAVKYNDKPEKHVIVGHARQAEGDVFFVRDNGIGIMPRYHQEVFRIFRRLNDEDDAVKGTGVGLTFVKKIVERHGGRIWIDSEPGRGSTFYFTLSADKEGTAHERDRAHIVG